MLFLRTGNFLTHAAVDGPPHAPAVVFVNGIGTDLRIWNDVVASLLPKVKAIRCDKRGHGLSELPPGEATMADLADDVAALMDQLRVARAVVVGVSVGGMIAQSLAARHPRRVAGLVLCCTAARIGDTAMWQARIDTVAAKGIEALADAVLARWFPPAVAARIPERAAGMRRMLQRTDPAGYAAVAAALRDADLTEATRALQLPTLCIAGSEDASTPPALVQSLASLIQDAEYLELAGSGHLPSVDAPTPTARAIENFLVEISHV
jgi:3-oxoadipate enol-lactonase